MLDKIKNNYYLLMGISIFCLIVIVFTSSYAYFKTQVRGEGKGMNVILGTIDLDITENSISTNNLLPISDSSKDTKAQIKDFTVKRTSNSNTDVCYNLYLVVDSISSNIKNSKYLKYELTDGSNVVSGNLSKLGYNSDGKGYILLAKNKYLSKTDTTGNTYKLKIWLSSQLAFPRNYLPKHTWFFVLYRIAVSDLQNNFTRYCVLYQQNTTMFAIIFDNSIYRKVDV